MMQGAGVGVARGCWLVWCCLAWAAPLWAQAPALHLSTPPLAPTEQQVMLDEPRLLADRFVYRAGDESAAFHAILPAQAQAATTLDGTLERRAASGDWSPIAQATHQPVASRKAHVRLPLATLEPGEYRLTLVLSGGAEATAPLQTTFRVDARRDPPPTVGAGGIEIAWVPQAPIPGGVWPLRAAVPLPAGLVQDVRRLAVLENGRAVPAGIHVRDTWSHDGSIRWVHVHVPGRVVGGRPARYALTLLTQPAPPTRPLVQVREEAGVIHVETDMLRFDVQTSPLSPIRRLWFDPTGRGRFDAPPVLDSASAGAFVLDGRKVRFVAADRPDSVVVEEQDAVSVTVRAEGWYRASGSAASIEPICRYVTRITAYAGCPMLRVWHHTILAYDTRLHRLHEVGFHLPLAASQAAIGIDGQSVALTPGKTPAFAHQERHDRVRIEAGESSRQGTRCDGWITLDSPAGVRATLLLRDFWQLFPKEVEITDAGVTLLQWPRHGRRAFDHEDELSEANIHKFWCFHQHKLLDLNMPPDYFERWSQYPMAELECTADHGLAGNGQGLAMGSEFALVFSTDLRDSGSAAGWARAFDEDSTGLASPAWNAATAAMGELAAADRDHFREQEDWVEQGFLSFTRSVERGGDYGVWNYADVHTYYLPAENRPRLHRPWLNGHYQNNSLPWLLYYRSGSPDLRRWARANTRHYIHVDTINYADEQNAPIRWHRQGSMYHCKAPTHWGSDVPGMTRRDSHAGLLGHWVDPDASLWMWLLDEDRRAFDTYQNWTAKIAKHGAPLKGTRREINTSLAVIVELYRHTHDPDLIPFIRGMGASLRAETLHTQAPGPMWHPMWINRYYTLTRDPAYEAWILEYGRWPAVGHTQSLPLAALAYDLTGDVSYLTAQLDWLARQPRRLYRTATGDDPYEWYGLGPGPLGDQHGWWTWPAFALRLRRAGIEIIPPARESWGYPYFSPRRIARNDLSPSVTILALESRDQEIEILRGNEYSHGASVRVLSPSGRVVYEQDKMQENQTALEPVRLPPDGETGMYRLEFRSHWVPLQRRQTNLPVEAGIVSADDWLGGAYGSRWYVTPLDEVDQPLTLQVNSSTMEWPVHVRVETAGGDLIREGRLFEGRTGVKTWTCDLDPRRHPPPWAIDIVGQTTIQLGTPSKRRFLFAATPEALGAVQSQLRSGVSPR
jgi:hypothetical protein